MCSNVIEVFLFCNFMPLTAVIELPTKKENNGKMLAVLGSRPTAGHIPLEDSILVRIQAPQLNPLEMAGCSFKLSSV